MLIESLLRNARGCGQDIAIIDDSGSHTFAEVAALAAGVAKVLGSDQTRKNIGILLPPGVGYVAAFYGILLAGKSVVPINFLLGAKEIAHVLADSGVGTVISSEALLTRLMGSLPGAEEIAAQVMASGMKMLDISTVEPASITDLQSVPQKADDMAVLMYTSGTAGLPKGVILSYANLQSDVDSAIAHAELKHQHKFLGIVPLFHSFGMTAMMIAPMQLAATVVYLQRFSPMGCLQAIREHGVSLLFGVPSMFAAIGRLKDAKAEDFANIYAMISGGEPLSPAIRELYKTRLNAALLEGYGLTETSPILAMNTPQAARAGSVGKALPGVDIRITAEDGAALPRNQQGEIQAKGSMIFKGYNNLPDATAAAFTPDGYFRTGDLGHVDDDGFLFITGRLKDLIIVSGEKAHPREIEDVLARHPAVAEAAVIGRKDESRGEVPVAFIVLREDQSTDANALRAFCREQGLVQWKAPKEVYFVKEFPRNPTGKVLKRELAQQLPANAG